MSAETGDSKPGWTVDTLKAMLDERHQAQTKFTDTAFATQQKAMETAFAAADKAVQAALLSAEKAVAKAEGAAEKRFEATNEFRGQLADQAATFLPRTEAEAIQLRNTERIDDIKSLLDSMGGDDQGKQRTVAMMIAASSVLIALVVVAVNVIIALAK